jgi:predicted phosphoribosyltransferase
LFKNRAEAGIKLAGALSRYLNSESVVLAIPRGGVVVGYELARELRIDLDIIVPRKIGAPTQPELAIGAVTEDGAIHLNKDIVESLGIEDRYIEEESGKQIAEIRRRMKSYGAREGRSLEHIHGRTVIVTDDGLATGATMIAAILSVKKYDPMRIIVAIPVSPPHTVLDLERLVDDVICLEKPELMSAIGEFYEDFEQVEDEIVSSSMPLGCSQACASEYTSFDALLVSNYLWSDNPAQTFPIPWSCSELAKLGILHSTLSRSSKNAFTAGLSVTT